MNTIDLTPLYRTAIGFDRWDSLLNSALGGDRSLANYPPYNIEVTGENEYRLTLAVAGFAPDEIDVQVENGVLTIRGSKKEEDEQDRKFLYQGIAYRSFERKFNLADHVEVRSARLADGLLTVELVREVPEAMKPRKIEVQLGSQPRSGVIEHQAEQSQAA